MNIVFLDIDGVLNCATSAPRFRGCIGIDPEKVRLLKQIVDSADAKIVLTSTWRLCWNESTRADWSDVHPDGRYLNSELGAYGLTIMSKTGKHSDGFRGQEIQDWIYDCGYTVENYVILDDDNDFYDKQQLHHVKTSWQTGLMPEHVAQAKSILRGVFNDC